MDSNIWFSNLICILSKYYNKSYHDGNIRAIHNKSRIINNKKYTVHRFNHGLIYAIRQGLLAVDIVNLFIYFTNIIEGVDKSKFDLSHNEQLINYLKWIRNKINTDKYFKYKLMFASSFQRTSGKGQAQPARTLGFVANLLKSLASAHGHRVVLRPDQVK